ncbi:MAG: lytic transglycosylase [Deltaproteobacteria bacterium]|nr:MAG: lytic transglycosylase [Deltaproteobacteria bacterium]
MVVIRLVLGGWLLCVLAWLAPPAQATPSTSSQAKSTPTIGGSSTPRWVAGRTSRKERKSKKRRRTRKRRRRSTRQQRNKRAWKKWRQRKLARLKRWRERRQRKVKELLAFLKKVGEPAEEEIEWESWGFPKKLGAFPLPRPLVPRIRMWKKVFGDHSPDTIIIYDLAHFVILRTVRTPGAGLLPGQPRSVRRAKSLARISNAKPVFLSLRKSIRALAAIERKAERFEKRYWWKHYKRCKILRNRSDRRRCKAWLRPQPDRYRHSTWKRYFRKAKRSHRRVLRTVLRSPQWQGKAWHRMFRDMNRRGLAWKTSYKAFFAKGFRIERRYGKQMRAALRKANLPEDLAALPFVESMYNPWVRSYVGALGLWQIMPATGREVSLYISPSRRKSSFLYPLDEREDPIQATKAAARFIKLCRYFFRDSWPLAMTSYNQGPGRVLKVIRRTKTRKLHKMIHRASKKLFGPDGRNFYSKFVAAALTLRDVKTRFPSLKYKRLRYRTYTFASPIWLDDLLRATRMNKETLALYNPMLRYLIKKENYNVHPIPAHFPLRFPRTEARKMKRSVGKLLALQSSRKKHFTRGKESLRTVAQRYHIPLKTLLKHNPHLQVRKQVSCRWPNKVLKQYRHSTCSSKCNHAHHQNRSFKRMVRWCKSSKSKGRCQRAQRYWKRSCKKRQRKKRWRAMARRLPENTLVYVPAVPRAAKPSADTYTYKVLGTEPLSLIACRNCTTVWHIRKLNPGLDIKRLRAGTKLRVPRCPYARRKLFRACSRHNFRRRRRRKRRKRRRRRRRRRRR